MAKAKLKPEVYEFHNLRGNAGRLIDLVRLRRGKPTTAQKQSLLEFAQAADDFGSKHEAMKDRCGRLAESCRKYAGETKAPAATQKEPDKKPDAPEKKE